ncbi:hypothetical protein EA462_01440 [Natrarchaeobius halalkaliphilus]|uniref:DUF7130 domain-containing protein n=1 Tax=Natrarchaeobius halalkaliphilus TaxID=1679091 RepID=A0A3N6LSJ0_9EURY|nr:hypothetical protein [Natrarchaeobius halalkaliphilus]RQG92913.1 hypothetical protein EA462_01440 [Natrarchaeobius halalkaliphilus]
MRYERERRRGRSELRNKEETEIPIGEPLDSAGRGYSMWRCWNCGEMGRLEERLPETCPSCAAPREELYYWEED